MEDHQSAPASEFSAVFFEKPKGGNQAPQRIHPGLGDGLRSDNDFNGG